MVEQKISLDFTKNGIQKTVYAKQGENGARDIIISLAGNGEPLDVSGYTLKMLFEDDTYLLLETENPVRFTVPQALCITTGEKICEIQITKDSIVEYAPQFRVTVEATIGATAGQPTPIGDPIAYEPAIETLDTYEGTLDGDEYIGMYDPDIGEPRKIHLSDIPGGSGGGGGRVVFSATATYDSQADTWSTGATLTGGKTIQDIVDAFNDGNEVYLSIAMSESATYLFPCSGVINVSTNPYVYFCYNDGTSKWVFGGTAISSANTLSFVDGAAVSMFYASATFTAGKPGNATLTGGKTIQDLITAAQVGSVSIAVMDSSSVYVFTARGMKAGENIEIFFGYEDSTNRWLYTAGGSETGLVFHDMT